MVQSNASIPRRVSKRPRWWDRSTGQAIVWVPTTEGACVHAGRLLHGKFSRQDTAEVVSVLQGPGPKGK